jgi:hypothetical protein
MAHAEEAVLIFVNGMQSCLESGRFLSRWCNGGALSRSLLDNRTMIGVFAPSFVVVGDGDKIDILRLRCR